VKLNRWRDFPTDVKRHLSKRLLDREITSDDLNKLQIWVESQPDVPADLWFKDFGSFKIVGEGPNPLTFLTSEQVPYGIELFPEDEASSTTVD
jgi:hypothetical protein